MYIRQTRVCSPLSPVIKDLNGLVMKSIGLDVAEGNESRAILGAKDEVPGEYSQTHRGEGLDGKGGAGPKPYPELLPEGGLRMAFSGVPNFVPQTLPEGVLWMM